MSRPKAALPIPLLLLLAVIPVVVACASPTPGGGPQAPASPTAKPGAGPQVPLSPSLLTAAAAPTPGKSGLSATMAGTPGKGGIPLTMAPPPAAATTAVLLSFSKDILPLLQQQCALCHLDQSMGGLSLKSYDSLVKGGLSGSPVVKGNPEASLLIRKLRGDPAVGERMPKGGPYLQDILILKVADWIRQGALNN